MDRYVIREPGVGVATGSGNAFRIPQNMYYSYGPSYLTHVTMMSPGLVVIPAQTFTPKMYPHQGQIVSGIDPRYFAAYSDNNASLITTGYIEAQPTAVDAFIQNRNFIGPERNDNKYFVTQRTQNETIPAPYTCVMPTEKPERQKTTIKTAEEAQLTHEEIKTKYDCLGSFLSSQASKKVEYI